MTDPERPRLRDLALTAVAALSARLLVTLAAWDHFPPTDDGVFYARLGHRLAAGLGYTWRWADGTVTPVAHYPVGYPALVALSYRVLGDYAASPLVMHAIVGALGACAVHAIAARGGSRKGASWAGLAAALHPALLSYTPAIMTEGIWSALVPIPFALVLTPRGPHLATRALAASIAGLVLGFAVLVRPETLLMLPVVAWVAGHGSWGSRIVPAVFAAAGACAAIAPWAVRNERDFGVPWMVSANAGWNLLIGTDAAAHGGWRSLEVPERCRGVWGEAAKDLCFERVARARIANDPVGWVRLVPQKLAVTFDYGGSGASYLSRSRPDRVPRWVVYSVGMIETVFERGCLLVALFLVGTAEGPRRKTRRGLAMGAAVFLLLPYGWGAFAGLALVLLVTDWKVLEARPLWGISVGVLATTMATHAVFFGAARYALAALPWVAAMAFGGIATRPEKAR